MFKNLLFTFLSLFIFAGLNAQIEVAPTTHDLMGNPLDHVLDISDDGTFMLEGHVDDYPLDVGMYSTITNTTKNPVEVSWKRTIQVLDDDWGNYICDAGLCYPETTSSGMFSLNAESSGTFDVHITNWNNLPGDALIRIDFIVDGATVATQEYDLHLYTIIGIDDEEYFTTKMYPNPAVDVLKFDFGEQTQLLGFEVYSIVGQKVKEVQLNGKANYTMDVNDLDEGMYFVRIYNMDNEIVETKTFAKTR